MMTRIMCFTSYLLAVKSLASASSSSSLADGFESRKSSTGSTMPLPFRWNQNPVHHRFGEEGVVRRRDPVRQRDAAVLARRDLRRGPAHELRLHRLTGSRLLHLAAAVHVNDLAARRRRVRPRLQGIFLLPHPCEERGEAVVVVLRPALEGVIVTLRRTASARRRTAAPSSQPGSAGRARCGSSWPAGWRTFRRRPSAAP